MSEYNKKYIEKLETDLKRYKQAYDDLRKEGEAVCAKNAYLKQTLSDIYDISLGDIYPDTSWEEAMQQVSHICCSILAVDNEKVDRELRKTVGYLKAEQFKRLARDFASLIAKDVSEPIIPGPDAEADTRYENKRDEGPQWL